MGSIYTQPKILQDACWTEKQPLLYVVQVMLVSKRKITSIHNPLGKIIFGDLKTWQVGCYLLSSIVFSVSTVLQKAPFTGSGFPAVTGSYGVCSGPFLFLAQCLWAESWHIRYPTIYRLFFVAIPRIMQEFFLHQQLELQFFQQSN